MNHTEFQYINLCKNILATSNITDDRTNTGTLDLFGSQMKFNLQDGFPLLTTKKIHFKSVVIELLWFLTGSTNTKFLVDNKVRIWNEWATPDGEIGNMYGANWRNWKTSNDGTIDQIKELIHNLKNIPNSRRSLVSAWNVEHIPDETISPQHNVEIGNGALPPCHVLFHCWVNNGKLNLHVFQRSVDVFLGLPFNIASYALLTHMLAQICGYEVGELVWTGSCCHIYKNHIEQVKTQVKRWDDREFHLMPTIELNKDITDIDDFTLEDIKLIDYVSEPKITGKIAV